jgi:hypothetical protein
MRRGAMHVLCATCLAIDYHGKLGPSPGRNPLSKALNPHGAQNEKKLLYRTLACRLTGAKPINNTIWTLGYSHGEHLIQYKQTAWRSNNNM